MVDFARELITVNLEDEMRQSYLDYAMSVIVGRALPDVRDGMKPVHRRVIHAMNESGNYWNKSYVKSARIVGDVMGSYHPHGDTAIYDTIVRMAQPFSMRYMLVDGQGNFGSVDGDAPAAMRYTEVRMAKFAHQLVIDIDKDTIDFIPNYDGSTKEPVVFPTRIPNLLVNGASGIAVGMATNIPPHNLGEVINAVIALIDNPSLTIDEIMVHIPGPDFPTAGVINGASGIKEAYKTGRGRIYMRAVSHIETDDKNGKQSIVFTELPYQVNKANLQKKIHELVKEKKIEGITETRDESDKDGMRLVLDLRRGEVAEVILNNLYKQTQLQNVFGINMVALVDGRPRLLNLKEILEAFIKHRREIVTRRTLFELRKDRARAHILEGLAIALSNIDEIVKLIRASATPAIAKQALMDRQWEPGVVKSLLVNKEESTLSRPEELDDEFGLVTDNSYQLTEVQAQSILDLRLHKLTGLEKDKIIDEYKEIIERIKYYLDILGNPETLLRVIKDELNEVKTNLNDARRTQILENHLNLTLEDLITEEEVIVTLSHAGYIKTQSVDEYQTQRRGGRGKSATKVKDEDFVEKMFVANTHDTILCFSNSGKLYWLKVYDLPVATRVSRGRPIVNMLPLEADEKIEAILPIKSFDSEHYVFMATRFGVVKKTSLADFSRPRSSGIIALNIRDGDRLLDAVLTDGKNDIMLVTDTGKAMRFNEENVRAMGRTAAGVRGIKINEDNKVVSVCVLNTELEQSVLLASQNGFGKRTLVSDFPTKNRGGQGVIALKTSERNGNVVGAAVVSDEDEVMLITSNGVLVRTSISGISCQGRNTQGVTLIKLDKGEKLQQVERLQILDDEDNPEDDHIDDTDTDTTETN